MTEDKKCFVIIDSNSIIHRAYHALPPLTTKKGELVNAVYGFLLVFLKALKDFQPDFIAAAFDTPGATFRHKKFKEYKNYFPGWRRAECLEKGDIILYPVLKETKDIQFLPFNIKKPKYDFKSKALPGRIYIDDNLLRLIGYYLSEGYTRTEPCRGTLGFAFRNTEKEYIQDVASIVEKIFRVSLGSLRTERNCTCIDFYSARLARFFKELFGSGAINKHLPSWAITLPP